MDENVKNRAVRLFHRRDPESAVLLDESRRENDSRAAYLIEEGGRKTVLKLAANGFTTPRRVEGWAGLIRETRERGFWSPALLPSLNGRLAETMEADGIRYVVWEEEFAPYEIAMGRGEDEDAYRTRAATRPRTPDGSRPLWQEELILFYADLGAAHLPGGWGSSLYVRLEAPEGEETDEVEECVGLFGADLLNRFPALADRWGEIRRRWEGIRDALAEIYPRLPSSVFQADWNDSNVLLTADGHFAGLIDYNLAGEDKVLNMAMSIGTYGFCSGGGGGDDAGRAAAPLLWHYLNDLYWSEVQEMEKARTEDEAAAVLDRVEKTMDRSVSFEAAMGKR